jgi:hypothetical protein
LGDVAMSVGDAEQSVTYADTSGDVFWEVRARTTHAVAMHQAGLWPESEARFREAEEMQTERQPAKPLLHSLEGFQYCELLLAASERSAWQQMQKSEVRSQRSELESACRAIFQRATKRFVAGAGASETQHPGA